MKYNNLTSEEKQKAFEYLVTQPLNIVEIAHHLGVAKNTVQWWLKKLNLKPKKVGCNIAENGKIFRQCYQCKKVKELTKEFFVISGKNNYVGSCKECANLRCATEQKRFKEKCLEYKGGKCVKCGYNQCIASIDFHHVDPEEKDFHVCVQRKKPWPYVKAELDKCIALCKNCHAELHYNRKLLDRKLVG